MAELIIEPIQDICMRDIHYIKNKYKKQIRQLQKERSRIIFKDWMYYEEWLITQGVKEVTIVKKLFSFKVILNLYTKPNLKYITEKELIELSYYILTSNYAQSTKRDIQIVLKQYLVLFTKTLKRERIIKKIIKVLPSVKTKRPEQLVSHNDFIIIRDNLKIEEFKITTKILYATGMRIIEAYNIINTPQNISFADGGIWINTKGKRTKNNKDGNYRYFMVLFVDEFKEHLKTIKPGEYILKFSYDYYYKSLKQAVKDGNIDLKVYPHLFRHTTATALFKKYQPQLVFKCMNWSPNSRMAETYSNLYDKDIANTLQDFKKSQNNDD